MEIYFSAYIIVYTKYIIVLTLDKLYRICGIYLLTYNKLFDNS